MTKGFADLLFLPLTGLLRGKKVCHHHQKMEGVDIKLNVTVVPASSSQPALMGEVYNRKLKSPSISKGVVTVLYAHGGAYCLCNAGTHRRLLSFLCLHSGARFIAIDYRRPPEDPHPACRDDMVRAYLQLVKNGTPPESIVFAGDSAGGGLCASALLKLRDDGHPLPAGAALLSPWLDLTDHEGGTWETNLSTDIFPLDMAKIFAQLVVGAGGDVKDPSVSPIFANLVGLPPLLIEAGCGEVLYGQIERFFRIASSDGVKVDFKGYPGMVHFFQLFEGMGQPEPSISLLRTSEFINRVARPFDILDVDTTFFSNSNRTLVAQAGGGLSGSSLDALDDKYSKTYSGQHFTTMSLLSVTLFCTIASYSFDAIYDKVSRDKEGYVDYSPGWLFSIIFVLIWAVRIYQHRNHIWGTTS